PISPGLKVPHLELVDQPELDPGYVLSNFTRDKLTAAAGGFVIKADGRASIDPVTLPIVHGDVMGKHLGHPIRAARMKPRCFRLPALHYLAEHFRTGGLQKARLGRMLADGLEHAQDPQAGYVSG